MPNTGAVGTPQGGSIRPGTVAAATPATPLTPFADTSANLLSSPDWQSQISGYLSGAAAPGIAQSGLSGALASAQLGMVGPQLGVSTAELGSNQGFSMANALLGYQGTQLQGQGLAEQEATAGQQQGIEESQYGIGQTQYPEQQAEAALANKNAVIGQRDSAAIGGTLDTTGSKRAQATQASEYGWQQADIFRNQQLAALGQQSEEVGFGGQEEQYANQKAQLDLAAKGQGLSAAQAQAQYGFGLQQLGINASPEQYLSQIAGATGAEAQQLAAVGGQAGLIGGLGAGFTGAALGG